MKFQAKYKWQFLTRNGFTPKKVKSKFGEIGLDIPRDRKSEFDPKVNAEKEGLSALEDFEKKWNRKYPFREI